MKIADWIGWGSSVILLVTLTRQVYLVTNVALLITAIVGEWIYLLPGKDHARSARR